MRDCPNVCAWFRARGLDVDEHDAVRGAAGRTRSEPAATARFAAVRAHAAGRARRGRDARGVRPAGWRPGRDLDGGLAAAGRRPARAHATCCARLRRRAARCSSAARFADGDAERLEARGRAGASRRSRTCRSTPTAPRLYTAERAVRRLPALRRHPRRPGLRLVAAAPATTATRCSPRRCTTTRSTTRSTEWVAGRRPGRRDGRARAAARRRRLRRRGPARARAARRRATSSPPAAARARWRPPTSAPTSPAATTTTSTRRSALLAAVPGFRPVGRRLGAAPRSTVRDRWPDGARLARASRPGSTATSRRTSFATAIAKYFRNAIREAILLQVCDAGIVFLPGRRRHRPGGLPGRLRELLRRRVGGGADGAGRPRATGPRRCPRGRCCSALARGPGDGGRTCTSSTPSRRPRRCWAPCRPRASPASLDRGELAAGAVDLAAAGVAHRGRDALGLEPADELALVGRVARRSTSSRASG